jgi:hypothetical protein
LGTPHALAVVSVEDLGSWEQAPTIDGSRRQCPGPPGY